MRKYILTTIFLSLGFLILSFTYFFGNKNEYTENIFSKESTYFDEKFSVFISDVSNNIEILKNSFQDPEKIRDTSFTRNLFTEVYNNDPYLRSIAFFQNNYKVGSKKEKSSIVFAIDSTSFTDIVQWKRYEEGKYISSWDESFDESVNKTKWFKKLLEKKNVIHWNFYDSDSLSENNLIKKDLFYVGYTYNEKGNNKTILLGISRSSMLNSFKHFSAIDSLKLIVKNSGNEIWDLKSGHPLYIPHKKNMKTDSLSNNILQHFKRFENKDHSIFNFNFKKGTFWNAYKILPVETGLKFYILTIPEYQLLKNAGKKAFPYLTWLGSLFILIGLILLLVKQKTFYFPKKVSIPPVKELLKEDENRYLEFKSSCRWDYRQEKYNPELENVISKTIAAFCNTDGGTLLIGVDDDKNFVGLEKDFATLKKPNPDYYEIHLRNILHKLMGVKNVSKNIRIAFEDVDQNKVICKIKVLASSEPIFIKIKDKNGNIKEKFYVRSGNSSQEIESIVEINDYINSRFKK